MGLSRNKVAVSEGAAGSPPFSGERPEGDHVHPDRGQRLCEASAGCCSILSELDKKLLIKKGKRWGHHGGVAQLGEHLPCKQGVMGSNPIISIKKVERLTKFSSEWAHSSAG